MRCAEARKRLLEAGPDELRPDHDGPLAAHLLVCRPCDAAAQTIRSFEADLAAQLGGGPRVDAAEVVRKALAADGAPPELSAARRRARSWTGREAWLALAMAAAIAVVFLWPRPPRPLPGTRMPTPAIDPPAVEAPAGHDVAVLPTSNPDITVLWFF